MGCTASIDLAERSVKTTNVFWLVDKQYFLRSCFTEGEDMKIYIVGLLILPTISLVEIPRNNEVDWVLASGGSHMIEWQNYYTEANIT